MTQLAPMPTSQDEAAPLRYDPFDPALQEDPYPTYRRMRDEDPLHRNDEHDFWALSRYDDILRATRDFSRYSSAQGLTFIKEEQEKLGLAPTFIMMDPPDHTRLRRLISKGFTPDRVAAMEERVAAFVEARLDRVADAGDAGVNIVEALTSPLPSYVLAEYLGVREEDRARFDPWSRKIAQGSIEPEKMTESLVAVAQMFQFFIQHIEGKRKERGDDLISVLLDAEIEGERLRPWDLLGFCFVFIAGGNDTTNHLLASGLRLLYEHPDQRAWLAEHPEGIPAAMEEMLRLESPVQGLSRTLTKPTELYGETLAEGSKVHLLFASGNRDERHFEDAERFDVRRTVDRHLAFSQGPHFCIGAHVARMMGRLALEGVLRRFPEYELDLSGAERVKSTFVRGYERLPFVR